MPMHRYSYLALLLLTACNGTSTEDAPSESTPQAPTAEALTYVYHCDTGYRFTARVNAADSWLFLPGITVRTPRVTSASGVKYSDGSTTFWSKGDKALLDHAGNSYRNCRNDRRAAIWEHAKLNGADFRAVGNEPGWHMEISNKHDIALVSDYGQSRYRFDNATISTSQEGRRTSYLADNGSNRIEVILLGETCQDSMADDSYETTVTVILDDRELRGCGRPLH
jgi:membrane-bound inhibitor of C-type lysozyme